MWSDGSGKQTLALLAAGGAILGTCVAIARPGSVSSHEEAVFRWINADLGPLERPLWTVMQTGNGLSAVVTPTLMIASGKPRADAVRAGIAGFGAWQVAKAVKRLVPRARPATLLANVSLRDGDPEGGGFVSGHATVSMATAVVLGHQSDRPVRLALVSTAITTGLARVHVGAHLPLDVVGGAGLGLIWGALCTRVPLPEWLEHPS